MRNTQKNNIKILINHGDRTLSAFIAFLVSVFMTKAELIVQTLRLLRDLDIPRSSSNAFQDAYIETINENYINTNIMVNDVLYRIDSIVNYGSTLKVNVDRVDKKHDIMYSLPISILNI